MDEKADDKAIATDAPPSHSLDASLAKDSEVTPLFPQDADPNIDSKKEAVNSPLKEQAVGNETATPPSNSSNDAPEETDKVSPAPEDAEPVSTDSKEQAVDNILKEKALDNEMASPPSAPEETEKLSPAPQDADPAIDVKVMSSPPSSPAVEKATDYETATPPPGSHYVKTTDEEVAVSPLSQSADPAMVPPKSTKSEFTSDTNAQGAKGSVVTIQHNIETTQQPRSNWGALGGIFASMSKPMVALVALMMLGGIGTWAYFFSQFLRIPGLEEQVDRLAMEVDMLELQVDELEMEVDRLTVQVDRLSNEVDRLEGENDRFEELNDELTVANEVFAGLIQDLEESNVEFESQNEQLNASVTELERQNEQLEESNEEFRSLNEQLNATNAELNAEIDELGEVTANLTSTNEQLRKQNEILANETEFLSNLTMELNETAIELANNVSALEAENDELRGLIDNLSSIVSFLNETAATGDQTFQELAAFLSEQIESNRALLLGVVQNTYVQTLTSWDCNLFDTFAGEPFIEDPDSPIGATSYPSVINEVDNLAMVPLCLDVDDFESYLATDIVGDGVVPPPVDVTMNQLLSGVNMYTTAALNYYFPDANELGLTQEDWVAAEYDCAKLPDDLKFSYL